MNTKAKLLTLTTLTFALSSVTVGTVIAQTKLTEQSKLFANGIGQVRVGMTVSQASKAAGTPLVGETPNKYCYYLKPESKPKNVGFMVTEGRISRVDVWRDSKITTLKGAKIGDTEARIKSLYPGQIQVTPHKYVQGGHYLIFLPKEQADKNYRVVFETDGKRVTQFRSGKLPEVEYVEGCS
jgi:outer membrane protein assembly factor BamE (lipoprotein component of BamABCDE complex)